MENKKLNLCEILKDCPRGTKLYSTVYGEVQFDCISPAKEDKYPIMISRIDDSKGFSTTMKSDGRATSFEDAECCLFPSKDNRDWSTFKIKKDRFDPKTLKPFDKVLIKHTYENERWVCSFFSDILPNGEIHCIGLTVLECIPYNDETAHLVGTTDKAPEYYKWWEE